jgi:hypothetical protein
VIIDGGNWTITEADVDRMLDFIERVHELEFIGPVEVQVSDDIGAGWAQTYQAFPEDNWHLLDALGLPGETIDRLAANQFRLDRIRGVCCRIEEATIVEVEIQPTKLATELIVIHELTHAIHVQHWERFEGRRAPSAEFPPPSAAATEGIPQYLAFAYLAEASPEAQAEVAFDLPIVRPDMIPEIGASLAEYLNFAYATGPDFVTSVVNELGADGLFELLENPPTSSEQILFPAKYLAGEPAQEVEAPPLPDGATIVASGTIGAATLAFVLTPVLGEAAARQMVGGWAGDRYIVFDTDEGPCLLANVVVDDNAEAIALQLNQSLLLSAPATETQVGARGAIELATCGFG